MEIVDESPFQVVEVKYKWDIKGLIWRPEEEGECVISPFFRAEGCPIEWALVVYPNGILNAGSKYVYVYLAAKENKYLTSFGYKTEAAGFRATGYFNLFKVLQGKREVLVQGQKFFPGYFKYNDQLKILLSTSVIHCTKPARSSGEVNMKIDETWSFEVEIKIGISSKTSVRLLGPELEEACKEDKMLEEALLEGIHSDVNLIVDGVVLKAHRAVLAARSPVFAAMFEAGMREANSGVVDVKEVTADVMRLLLRYIYTGSLDETANPEEVELLLMAAERYELAGLKARCEASLIRSLNPENAAHLLTLAEVHRAKHLKEGSLRCIASNIRQVFQSEGYKELLLSQPCLLDVILKHLYGVQDQAKKKE